jgi:hypothetical protein
MAYGNPPYSESSLKSALRIAAAGLGSVPRGANFGTAFLAAAGGASKAYGAAQQAAQEYALKQQQMQEQQSMNEFTKAHLKAQTDALSREKTPPPPKTPTNVLDMTPEQFDLYVQRQWALKKATTTTPGSATGGDMPGLSSEALDQAALRYSMTGVLPSMGMSKQSAAYRAEIINRAATKYPQSNIAANLSDYKKDSASLTNVQKIRDAAAAWEQTAGSNADVMLRTLRGVPDTGNRPLNSIVRGAYSQMGSPSMAAFNTARETMKVEYARLLQSPGVASGVLSDTARREIENVVSGNLTKPQLIRSLQVLKRDAVNRRTSYDKQLGQIQGRLRNNPVGAAATMPTAQQPQTQEWIRDANGNLTPANP